MPRPRAGQIQTGLSRPAVRVQALGGLRGWIDGCLLTRNDANDVTVGTGQLTLTDGTNDLTLTVSSSIRKQSDANWAEGTAAGGFPSGLTITADTNYRKFVIAKSNGEIDAGWDTSATAANLLADATDYTFYREVGVTRTDAAATTIRDFTHSPTGFFALASPVTDVTELSPPATPTTTTSTAPADSLALYNVGLARGTGGNGVAWILPTNAASAGGATIATAPGSCVAVQRTDGAWAASSIWVQLDASAQFAYRCNDSGNDLYLHLIGWLDSRGRNA